MFSFYIIECSFHLWGEELSSSGGDLNDAHYNTSVGTKKHQFRFTNEYATTTLSAYSLSLCLTVYKYRLPESLYWVPGRHEPTQSRHDFRTGKRPQRWKCELNPKYCCYYGTKDGHMTKIHSDPVITLTCKSFIETVKMSVKVQYAVKNVQEERWREKF